MNRKFLRVVFLTCLVLLVFGVTLTPVAVSAAAPEGAPAKNPERVLARVDGQEIKEKDVDQILVAAGPQAAMMYDNEHGRKMVLEELIASRLFALSGKKQKLDETPEFKTMLENFVSQAVARAAVESAIKEVAVTEEDSKKFYDENLDSFTTPDQIRASHILLPDDETSADKIAMIQEELKKGTAFEALAAEHSACPSKQRGGDLGLFSRGQMVAEFEEPAFALKEPGDMSEPVKSPFGWHFIRLEEKVASVALPYDDVRQQIEQYLINEKRTQRYEEELEALKKEYTVEILVD